MGRMIVDVRPYPVLDAASNVLVCECGEIEMNAVVFNLSLLAGSDWKLAEMMERMIDDLNVIFGSCADVGAFRDAGGWLGDSAWARDYIMRQVESTACAVHELRSVWEGE